MDKNLPPKEMSLAFPLSAGAVYQFLSSQGAERGLKIKNAYTTKPVLTVREKSQPLGQEQRQAWEFHLKEVQQRQAGTREAEHAAALIESFLKSDAARATPGILLKPVAALMEAEQACIQRSSSIVRRWMANEQNVQEIATSTDERDASPLQANQYKNALTLARQMLAKFPDFQDGEINVELIRDSAHSLGSVLGESDMQDLQKARLIIAKRSQQLTDYIGPEVPLLIELCMCAKGAPLEEYRAAYETKDLCSRVAAALRARTDNEEYVVPPSPRNNAEKRPNLKTSVPSITGHPAAHVYTGDASRTTATSPRAGGSTSSKTVHTDMSLPASPVSSRTLPRSVTEGTPAALVAELKGQQRQPLTHSLTLTGSASSAQAGQTSDTTHNQAALTRRTGHARSASSTATLTEEPVIKPGHEKRRLRRSMQYDAPPLEDAEHGRKPRPVEAEDSGDGTRKLDREFREKRKKQKAQRLSQPVGIEMKALQQQSVPALESRTEKYNDMNATPGTQRAARGDDTLAGKWHALESKLGSQLHADGRAVVNKLLPYWKSVDLHKLDKALFSSLVLAAGMSRQDRTALAAVLDALLADSLHGPQGVAATVFPELLALVVYSIDAQRNLPRAKN